MKVSIEVENPEKISHDLADLLCWWEGFRSGIMLNSEYNSIRLTTPENGIIVARDLNEKLKDAANKYKNGPVENISSKKIDFKLPLAFDEIASFIMRRSRVLVCNSETSYEWKGTTGTLRFTPKSDKIPF